MWIVVSVWWDFQNLVLPSHQIITSRYNTTTDFPRSCYGYNFFIPTDIAIVSYEMEGVAMYFTLYRDIILL